MYIVYVNLHVAHNIMYTTVHVMCFRYRELIRSEPTEALRYLKTVLAECVNHSNTEQSEEVSD